METDILELVRQAKYSLNHDSKLILIYLLKKMKNASIELSEEQRREYVESMILLLALRMTVLQATLEYDNVTAIFIEKVMRLVKKIIKVFEVIKNEYFSTRCQDSFFLRIVTFLLNLKEMVDKQYPSRIEWKVSLVEACFTISFTYPDFMKRNQRYMATVKKKLSEFSESKKIEERGIAQKFDITKL